MDWDDEDPPWPAAPPPPPPPAPAPPAPSAYGHPPTPRDVRFPGDRYDMTYEQWKAATPPAPPITPDKGAPVSGMVLWFEHEVRLAKASHGRAWPEHKRFAVDYLREEMAAWIGADQAAQGVEKAAARARG